MTLTTIAGGSRLRRIRATSADVVAAVADALFDRAIDRSAGDARLRSLDRMTIAQRAAVATAALALDLQEVASSGVGYPAADRARRRAALERWERAASPVVRGAFLLLKMTALLSFPERGGAARPVRRQGDDAPVEVREAAE